MAIWGRLKKYLIRWPLYFVLVAFPILIGASHYVHSEFYRSKMLQSLDRALRHWPKFVEDLKILDSQNIARPITRNQNAALFLAERVTWDHDEENVTDAQRPARLARNLLRKYATWGSEPEVLTKLLSDPELKTIDASWIKELSQFDYFDLSVTKNQKDQLDRLAQADVLTRIGIIASLPMLELMQALDLATVAVFQAHIARKPREEMISTLAVIDSLFHLFQSSPTLVDQSLAVATLGRKQSLLEALQIKGVSFVPQEMRLRIRRVAWMWASVMYLSSLKEFESALAEVRPFMKTTNFLCGGSDPFGTHAIFRSALVTKWPLAPNYEPALAREADYIKKTAAICGIPLSEILLSLPDPENNPTKLAMPYLSSIYFSILNSIAVPSFSTQYDDLEAESKNK
jgi:hypothetical protein